MITVGDVDEVHRLTKALSRQFEMKELGQLKYFLALKWHTLKMGFLSADINIL